MAAGAARASFSVILRTSRRTCTHSSLLQSPLDRTSMWNREALQQGRWTRFFSEASGSQVFAISTISNRNLQNQERGSDFLPRFWSGKTYTSSVQNNRNVFCDSPSPYSARSVFDKFNHSDAFFANTINSKTHLTNYRRAFHFSASIKDASSGEIPKELFEGDGIFGYQGVASPIAAYGQESMPLDAVVKVFTVSSSPNYFLPWQNKPQREVTGSGFVVSGNRIITNAHVVADQTFVMVRKHGSPIKYRAYVEAVGHECDLALLRVEEPSFWDSMYPLEFGDIPQLQEQVAVVGYPQGGDNISVTGGVVSRVELTQYAHGASHLIAIQIDAAINPGNSGGPALLGDKVAGVAFQNLANAENIGYIIPVPVVNHFLRDVKERRRYVGFCSMGLTCQALENAQLRAHLKLPAGTTGVLLNKIQPLSNASQWLKKDDVLLAFDGTRIANDGTVPFRKRERIAFDHLVSMKRAGETGRVQVLRDGKELEFDIQLDPLQALVPIQQFDSLPSYFIFAGLVFVPLAQPYLHEYGDDWYNTSPRKLCERALREVPTKRGEQLVILSQVLMDDVNAGYERLAELQVKKVNCVDVHNLRHFQYLVNSCTFPTLRLDFEDSRVAVLDMESAKHGTDRILRRYRIPSAMSEDLKSPISLEEMERGFEGKELSSSSGLTNEY